jgi:transposase
VITSHSSRKSNGVSKSRPRRSKRARVPARGRRYSPAEHARALSLILAGMQREQVAEEIGCSTESLRRWYVEGKKQGLVTKAGKGKDTSAVAKSAVAKSAAAKPAAAEPAATSAPHDPGAGLGEHEVKAILDYKRKHPSMGPAQIRAQLKRFLGWRVSVKAIARVLRKAGYAPVHRKGRPVGDEHSRRFEAPHRNSLWQLDFTELRVGSERRWLLVIEDDFSRFVVGHVLAEGPTSEVVVAAMREAIRLHGKPERVYLDYVPRNIIGVLCPTALCGHVVRSHSRITITVTDSGYIMRFIEVEPVEEGRGRCAERPTQQFGHQQ